MDATHSAVIALMKSAVTGIAEPLPEGFDLEQIEELVSKQAIDTLVYAGAVKCGIPKNLPVMQRLFQKYIQLMFRSEGQMAEVKKLFKAFDENGIDYLPLKGVLMKELYPAHELRYMGDADILIKTTQEKKIRDIMLTLGYSWVDESDHELVWKSPGLYVEFHKRLIPSYNIDFYSYFGDGWSLAKTSGGTQFAMSPENNFIFEFVHMAKHYRDGGVGARFILDLWMLQRAYPKMDKEYILNEFKKLKLDVIYKNVGLLISSWFESGEATEVTEFMTQRFFSGDSWGNAEDFLLRKNFNTQAKQTGSFSFIMHKLFPGLEEMSWHYRALKKFPWLLPFFWPVRLVHIALFRRDKIRKTTASLNTTTDDKLKAYMSALKYVGLEYDF